MSDPVQASRELEPIEDATLISQFIAEGANTTSSLLIWAKDQDWNIQSYLSMMSEADKIFYAWIPKDFDLPKFNSNIAALESPDCLFSLSLQRANLFFKARVMGVDSAGIQLEIPKKVYKVQRRKHIRFLIPSEYSIPVEFEDPLFPQRRLKKGIIDISEGGFSFDADPLDSPLFQEGLVLKKVKLYIRMRSIQTEVEIRHKKLISQKSLKVGVSFKDISAKDIEAIAAYVFDENRKFFSRLL